MGRYPVHILADSILETCAKSSTLNKSVYDRRAIAATSPFVREQFEFRSRTALRLGKSVGRSIERSHNGAGGGTTNRKGTPAETHNKQDCSGF